MILSDLLLNNQKLDIYDKTDVRFTSQVNDISELKDRQTSFTDAFTIPKTANNVLIMQGLGISSDTSEMPYSKPDCRMKIGGFDIVQKGWLSVKETDDEYKLNIYSGIINFFKSIENKTLGGDLNLTEIDHEKNLDNVIASIYNPFYKYFITDYNGKTHFGVNNDIINIDYLQPSVIVSYLFRKIHNDVKLHPLTPFNFVGKIFESDDFKQLYFTYPKALDSDSIVYIPYFEGSGHLGFLRPGVIDMNSYGNEMTFQNGLPTGKYVIPETGRYRIKITLTNVKYAPVATDNFYNLKVYASKNNQELGYYDRIQFSRLIYDGQPQGAQQEVIWQEDFNKHDVLSFFSWWYVWNRDISSMIDYSLVIEKVDNPDISFSDEFKDFLITDFLKEIVNRFALTMFFDEYSNTVEYQTIDERVNDSEIEDWTDKFIARNNENYISSSYAQKNSFEYQYNDKEASHKNGFISVNNKNLQESKTIFKSKTYAPESGLTSFFINPNKIYNAEIFKFYDKEVSENQDKPVKYKPLQKRYFFIKGEMFNGEVKIGSETLESEETTSMIYLGSFSQLDWESILAKYYYAYTKIINDGRIHDIQLDLNDVDLLLLDHRKLYYFGQEQQYYIINKIKDSSSGTVGEMLRVKFSRNTFVDNTNIIIQWNGSETSTNTHLENYDAIAAVTGNPINPIWQKRTNNGNWIDIGTLEPSMIKNILFNYGLSEVRIKYDKEGVMAFSNVINYTKAADSNKCYVFELQSSTLGTKTIKYINYDGFERTETITFNSFGQIINVNAKQIIDLGGCEINKQTEIECPTYECRKYSISSYLNSGDDLTVTYVGCDGIENTEVAYYAGNNWVTIEFCSRDGQFIHNSRETPQYLGLC